MFKGGLYGGLSVSQMLKHTHTHTHTQKRENLGSHWDMIKQGETTEKPRQVKHEHSLDSG